MAKAKYSNSITLKNVEIGFVHLAEPTPKMSGDGMEYSCQVIVPKDHAQAPELIDMMKKGIETAFGDMPKEQRAKLKIAVRDNDKEGNSKKYEHLQNTYFFNSKRQVKKGQVPAVNQGATVMNPFTPEQIFSGCMVNLVINFYSYNHTTSKGIAASVEALQLVDNIDVVRRDGGVDVSNAFQPLAEDESLAHFAEKAEKAAAEAAAAPSASVVSPAAQMDSAPQDAIPEEGMATEEGDGLPW